MGQSENMKKRYTLIIEILIAVIFGIIGGMLFVLVYEKSLPIQGVGSLADWASAILSFVAILVVFWQVNRESQNERAFYIENKRPHFSAERTTIIHLNEKILYHKSYGDLKTLYEKLHDDNHPRYIIRLTNLSDNIVHSLKIILRYNGNRINSYALDGLFPEQSILLVTDEEITNGINPIELWIRFETAANEIGYFHFKAGIMNERINKYIFIKGKEPVTAYGNDEVINKESDRAKELGRGFGGQFSRSIVTISEEEFDDLKRHIHGKEKNKFQLK